MLYLKHDFYSNFNAGVNSGDNELLSDMIVNELSELIVYRHADLVKFLNKVGIKTKEKVSNEKLVDSILENLSKNVKLSKGLAFLICENNQVNEKVRVVKGSDGKERKVAQNQRAAEKSEIDMVATGIVGIGDSFKYKPQLKKEFKLNLMTSIKTKTKAVGDLDRKHTEKKNGKYVLLGIVVIGLSVGAYFYLKYRKKKAAQGLELDGGGTPDVKPEIVEPKVVEPIVETPPVVQPQPVVQPVAAPQPVVQPIVEPTIPTPQV